MTALATAALAYVLFVGLAVVLPGLAVLRALRVRPEAAFVLPTGFVACAAMALASAAFGWPLLFPALALAADASFLIALVAAWLRSERRIRWPGRAGWARAGEALAPVAVLFLLLLATRFFDNRVLPSGDFRVDSLNWKDAAFHVGLVRELTHAFPPQVPGLAGIPLSYHFGLDLVRSVGLRFAGIDPYDALTRFDPLLWATALVLSLRAATALLGGGRLAVALAGFAFLAGDFGFLWAFSTVPHYWINHLRGNFLLAVVDANSAVPALAVALAVVVALGRRTEGGGRKYLALGALLAFALPGIKVFAAAHLALGLATAFLLARERRAVLLPLLAAGAGLLTLLVVEHGGQVVVRTGPLLILPEIPQWLRPLPVAAGSAAWLLLWLCASLGLRLVALPRALGALRSRHAVPVALATMALSGWLIGLVFDVSPRSRMPKERLFNEAGYFVEQSGALLWVFAALALAGLLRRHGRPVLVAAAALAFPTTVQFVVHHRTRPSIDVPAAVLEAMRVLERDSRPGDVVLQRPHPRWPPPPVVFTGRRVPMTRIYPYLSQFMTAEEFTSRQQTLRQFFGATDPAAALLAAGRFGATHAVAYEDDAVASGALAVLVPIFEDPAVRVYRIRYR